MKALIALLLISGSVLADESTPKGLFSYNGQEYTKEQFDAIRPRIEAEQEASRLYAESDSGKIEQQKRADAIQKDDARTSCIYFGNAYVTAINIRNQWSFADPKDSYNLALNQVAGMLQKWNWFNVRAIVDNVFYNPDYRYPVGGNPLLQQMHQVCINRLKERKIL